jgi:hypothetical protein
MQTNTFIQTSKVLALCVSLEVLKTTTTTTTDINIYHPNITIVPWSITFMCLYHRSKITKCILFILTSSQIIAYLGYLVDTIFVTYLLDTMQI